MSRAIGRRAGRVGIPGVDGQAAVEVVALAPLVAVLLTGLAVALQAHRAHDSASVAAHAGAVAALVGRDPIAAARAAAPDVSRERLRVTRTAGRITVAVRAEGPRSLVRSFDAEQTVILPKGTGQTRAATGRTGDQSAGTRRSGAVGIGRSPTASTRAGG